MGIKKIKSQNTVNSHKSHFCPVFKNKMCNSDCGLQAMSWGSHLDSIGTWNILELAGKIAFLGVISCLLNHPIGQ